MRCPICDSDLSPLDLVSRTEHVDLCIENGPSVLEVGESGQLVVKRNLPPGKERKICPICDKTFQQIRNHFKTCAIKNDVPPNLMLDYWDKINGDIKNPKKFPRELLDSFVAKCIKEGRIGEQVDFARALSLSMADGEPQTSRNQQPPVVIQPNEPLPTDSVETTTPLSNLNTVLMQSASSSFREGTSNRRPKKKYRLELVDELTKKSNVELRIDRELAATRSERYQEALKVSKRQSTEEVGDIELVILDDEPDNSKDGDWRNKLFFLNRLKDCDGSESCLSASCQDHELMLTLEEFKIYSGASMDAAPKRRDPQCVEVSDNPQPDKSQTASTSGEAGVCVR